MRPVDLNHRIIHTKYLTLCTQTKEESIKATMMRMTPRTRLTMIVNNLIYRRRNHRRRSTLTMSLMIVIWLLIGLRILNIWIPTRRSSLEGRKS